MNAKEELYGTGRFEDVVSRAPADPAAVLSAVLDSVSRFTGLTPQHDDLTPVCFGARR